MTADASGAPATNEVIPFGTDWAAPSAASPFQPPVALTSLAGLRMVATDGAGFCGPDGCYTSVSAEAKPAD